jgi:hypothetical protein
MIDSKVNPRKLRGESVQGLFRLPSTLHEVTGSAMNVQDLIA